MKFTEYIIVVLIVVLTACSTFHETKSDKASETQATDNCILPGIDNPNHIVDERIVAAIKVADKEFERGIDYPCIGLYQRSISQSEEYFKIVYLPESQDTNFDIVGGDIAIYIDKKSLQFVKAIVGQ